MLVTCAQVELDIDQPESSWGRVLAAVDQGGRDADVLVLPELANSGYVFNDAAEAARRAEPLDAPRLLQLADASRRHRVVIVAGWCEAAPDGPFSSAVVLDHGRLVGVHRKCHLWDAESLWFSRGTTGPLVVDTSVGRLAALVCYDLEFPEFVRRAAEAGAELVAAPVNWPLLPRPAGERPLELHKAQAYAGAYRIPIAIADRAGTERGVAWIGGSAIVGSDGYLSSTPPPPGPAFSRLVSYHVTRSTARNLGPRNHALGDRRPLLYGPATRPSAHPEHSAGS